MASGRVMVVTGASSGIGRALAERAARAGYFVVAVGRREDRLADLVKNAAAHGGEIIPLAVDLREPGAAERITSAARSRFGGIDVLVNNAGAVASGALTAQSDGALREQFDTHVLVPLALVREAHALLRASSGHVFFLGSGVARVPIAGLGAYPAAKAAVRAMSRIVRNELRADGIKVTYVDPGAVDTEFMTRAGMAPAPRSLLVSPHEVARKIFNAIGSDRRELNAVPWQTAIVALAEHFPGLTDALLQRSPALVGGAALDAGEPLRLASAAPVSEGIEAPPALAAAVEPEAAIAPEAPAEPKAAPEPEAVAEPQEAAEPEAVAEPEAPAEPQAPAQLPEPAEGPGAAAEPAAVLEAAAEPEAARQPAESPPESEAALTPEPAAKPHAPARARSSQFDAALAFHATRMRKLNLDQDFVASLLVPGAELELGDVAMRWAGMPNKNERAVTLDVLDALADANFLSHIGAYRYRVLKPADADD